MFYCDAVYSAVSQEDWKILETVTGLLQSVRRPEDDRTRRLKGIPFNCHSICRALVLEIRDGSVRLVDGELGGMVLKKGNEYEYWVGQHSWLETRSGHIIDPYPMHSLSLSAILLPRSDAFTSAFTTGRYRPDPNVLKRDERWKAWRDAYKLRGAFDLGLYKASLA